MGRSNLAFKKVFTFPVTDIFGDWASLPYSFTVFTHASASCSDIGPNVGVVNRWVTTPSEGYETYICAFGFGTDFPIVPGAPLNLTVSDTTVWIVVGAHDNDLALSLKTGVTNWISLPYNTTATKAAELFAQIPNCASVARVDPVSGSTITNTGSPTRNNFTVTTGEGFSITVSSDTTWKPPVY